MRVISFNANGIRSAANKGFFQWLQQIDADIICIQETKAQEHQLATDVFYPTGYHCYYFDAEKKGYSGVAIYSKVEPEAVIKGLDWTLCDCEGRYIQADFPGLSVASLYLPSGSSGDERQAIKIQFLDKMSEVLRNCRQQKQDFIICGDWNIVHKEIDIKNWRSNQKNSGCLPEERAWLDLVFDEIGFVDGFRVVNQEPHQYTWWSNRGQAYANNVGWRIDYHVVTPNIAKQIRDVAIYKDEKFSDHAPLIIDYEYTL